MIDSERSSAIHCPDLMSYWALLAPIISASERPVESSFGRKQMCSRATRQNNERPKGKKQRSCAILQSRDSSLFP